MNCPSCNNTHTRKASKLAYREGVYFCLDCAIYFPCKKLAQIMENEIWSSTDRNPKSDRYQVW